MAAPLGNKNHTIHGGHGTRLYIIWKAMRQRCHDSKCIRYANYGGRGISICAEWDNFSEFRHWAITNGYADALSIDRIDVNGNYEPSNCRWADLITQANNKTNNVIIEFEGSIFTMAEFCREKKLKYKLFAKYIKRGMSVADAMEKAS